MSCCSSLSKQEKILQDTLNGKVNVNREKHKRLFTILDTFNGMAPIIDADRARLFTESMKETEGQPLTLRWAKALMNIAQNIPVYIDDNQLLAGRCGVQGRYGILYPELDGDFMADSLERLANAKSAAPISVRPEVVKIVKEEITPYWKGKTFHEDLNNSLPPEIHKLAYNDDLGVKTRFVASENASFRSSQQWVLDYAKVINRSFADIKAEAQAKLDALDPLSPIDTIKKKPFLEAVILTCDAIVIWAKRHSQLAFQKAQEEKDPVRKQELLDIAERCSHVPEFPSRNFREAVQAQWFAQMFSRLEQRTGTIISNGRMDQYFYPLYKKDIEAGIITDEDVLEMLDCMWVGMAQFTDISLSPGGQATQEGYAHWEAVTIGGQIRDGKDATNELSYLILKSRQESPMPYPDLAARIHARSCGGLTLSGGEPLMQYDFVELLTQAKERHIHRAIESSGFADTDKFLNIASLLNYLHMDVKHLDSKKHEFFTDQPNELILHNIEEVRKAFPSLPLHLRTPVIPGANDDDELIKNIAQFGKKIGAYEYELLPYHKMGQSKYHFLGLKYPMVDSELDEDKFHYLQAVAKKYFKG